MPLLEFSSAPEKAFDSLLCLISSTLCIDFPKNALSILFWHFSECLIFLVLPASEFWKELPTFALSGLPIREYLWFSFCVLNPCVIRPFAAVLCVFWTCFPSHKGNGRIFFFFLVFSQTLRQIVLFLTFVLLLSLPLWVVFIPYIYVGLDWRAWCCVMFSTSI